ncbi:hypothetical protein L0156_17610 [bacterium]|nr:hypothetical protein [bacterium]
MNPNSSQLDQLKEELKLHLRRDLLRVRQMLPLALVAAFFFTIVVLDLSPKFFAKISITATGQKKSSEAQAAVAWLASPTIGYLQQQDFDIRKSIGWETKNDLLISNRNQPAELTLEGPFSLQKALEFFKTPYSGEIVIEASGSRKVVDLFQSDPGKEFIFPRDLNMSKGAILTVGLAFLLSTAKYLCLLLVFAFGFQTLTATLPDANIHANELLLTGSTAILMLFLAAFYPGVMYVDSYDQYFNARAFSFGDWHPPMMSILWSLSDRIIEGPGGMLILHLLMAVCSFYLLSRVALWKKKKLFFVPLILIFLPVVSCISFAVVKDVSFTMSLLFAFSLWYYWRSKETISIPKLALILLLLFYSSAVRYNALPAILPLIFLFLLDYTSRKKALLIAPAICLFFLLANHFVVYTLFRATREYAYQVIMGHDLMGIYEITGKNYLPDEYIKKETLNNLMRQFDHRTSDPTAFYGFPLYYEGRLISILENQWFTAIRQNPAAYLTHRWILFKNFLSNFGGTVFCMFPVSVPPQSAISGPPRPLLEETALGKLHTKFVTWTFTQYGFLFEALTYLFGSCILLVIAIRKKSLAAGALNASSLLYLTSYFIVAPGVHFRYVYWSVLATLLSLLVLWMERKK